MVPVHSPETSLRQVERLLARVAVLLDRLDRALGQHRAEAEGQVGGLDDLEDGDLQRLGQALAAVRRRRPPGCSSRPSANCW